MLKQLRYFQSVVRNGSFSEAAEENFISQSAISQQIQALERELGVQLLERRNRSFRLTPAGEFFYQKSLVLVADYEKMCVETVKLAKGEKAKLRIGYLRCYAGDVLFFGIIFRVSVSAIWQEGFRGLREGEPWFRFVRIPGSDLYPVFRLCLG